MASQRGFGDDHPFYKLDNGDDQMNERASTSYILASYQKLKKRPNSGRFCNSSSTGAVTTIPVLAQ